jgi:hypothetical protein
MRRYAQRIGDAYDGSKDPSSLPINMSTKQGERSKTRHEIIKNEAMDKSVHLAMIILIDIIISLLSPRNFLNIFNILA